MFIADGTHKIGGGTTEIPPSLGAYSLKIGDHVHLRLGHAATLVRNFFGKGEYHAMVRNAGYDGDGVTGNEHIRVSGGTLTTVDDCFKGRLLAFVKTTNLRVDGVQFTGVYEDWNASFFDCGDVIVSDDYINSGTTIHTDGLHFSGGSRIAVANCVIICGDDCLAITHEPDFKPENQMLPTTDVVATNCVLHSKRANAVRIQVYPFVEPPLGDRAIRRVHLSNIVAKCGVDGDEDGAGIVIDCAAGLNVVSDIQISQFFLDANHNNGQCARLSGVRAVKLTEVVMVGPLQGMAIDGCIGIDLVDCGIRSPRGENQACLAAAVTADCSLVRILGGAYRNASHHGLVLGSASYQLTLFEISNADIALHDLSGISVVNAHDGLVVGNAIYQNSGWGIVEASASSDNVYIANRLYNNASGPIFYQGTDTHVVRNFAQPNAKVADTGGFRQTIDGWTYASIGSNQSATEMTRAVGRFRAVRSGSVTGVVLTTTKNRTGGTMTATVYKNSSIAGAGGSTVSVSATIDGTTSPNRAATTQAENITAAQFAEGDELYIVIESSGWTVATGAADVICALEIEN